MSGRGNQQARDVGDARGERILRVHKATNHVLDDRNAVSAQSDLPGKHPKFAAGESVCGSANLIDLPRITSKAAGLRGEWGGVCGGRWGCREKRRGGRTDYGPRKRRRARRLKKEKSGFRRRSNHSS